VGKPFRARQRAIQDERSKTGAYISICTVIPGSAALNCLIVPPLQMADGQQQLPFEVKVISGTFELSFFFY